MVLSSQSLTAFFPILQFIMLIHILLLNEAHNEKQNSLVRRFLPEGKSFDDISDDTIAFIEDWINNLPRKLFDYHSSAELFDTVLFDIAI